MKKPLIFLLLAAVMTLTGCNDIRVSFEFRYWQIQTDLIVHITNARPNVRLKVWASSVPRTPDKTAYVETDAHGNARVTFEYPYHRSFCDLNEQEQRQKGVVVVTDENNPDPDRVTSNLFQFVVSPLFRQPVGGLCEYRGGNSSAPAISFASR